MVQPCCATVEAKASEPKRLLAKTLVGIIDPRVIKSMGAYTAMLVAMKASNESRPTLYCSHDGKKLVTPRKARICFQRSKSGFVEQWNPIQSYNDSAETQTHVV